MIASLGREGVGLCDGGEGEEACEGEEEGERSPFAGEEDHDDDDWYLVVYARGIWGWRLGRTR